MAGNRYILQMGRTMANAIYDSRTDKIVAETDSNHGELIRDLLNENDKEVPDAAQE